MTDKIELDIPPVGERTAKWMEDQMRDHRGEIICEPWHPPEPPQVIACGVSPSGKVVPIRVDEDGYVLVKVSTVVGTHGSKQ
jgi:hypothetical protein